MTKRKISVIIPVFNGETFLAEAIQSVLDQNFDSIEIIVVDDGSTDSTAKVVELFGNSVTYFYQENSGVAIARNIGLELATGDYIAFIDADDIWPQDKLLLQIALFSENDQTELVLGLLKRFLSPGASPPPRFMKTRDEQPVLTLSLGAGLFKKSVFDRVGEFDKSMHFSEDIDWCLRAIETGTKVSILEEVFYLYRIHQHNITQDINKSNMYLLKAVKKSLDRRRKMNPENPLPLPDFKNPDRLKQYFNLHNS